MINKNRFRLRMIVPMFPNFNIYTFTASTTTSLGPISVATSASKLELWDVEVIDENNCHGKFFPRNELDKLDHEKLQKERPADVVGLYGSISSTIPRLFELAKFYRDHGAIVIAGGKHVEALPEEALANNVEIVAFREGEITIKEILLALQNNSPLDKVKGIAFKRNNDIIRTQEQPLIEDFDRIPIPDFNLMRYEKMKYYPINRTRGCNSNCEFCAVKDKARCSTPQYMMNQIKHLVETRKAKYFFEASDHFAANKEEAIEFCEMLAAYQKEINKKLIFTVQTRITDARYPELLLAMKEAGIDTVCIGYESPIDEELLAMKKGYISKDLIDWTNIFHKHKFYIHGMFIFGYPKKSNQESVITLDERAERFHSFIKKAKLDTVQIMITIPLPGTELRERLDKENRIYPLEKIGWEYYDGQFPLFKPDQGISPEELQLTVGKIMQKFYHFQNFWKLVRNILFHFPGIVFTSSLTILLGRVNIIRSAFNTWKRKYFRNYILRFGGHIVAKQWFKNFKKSSFPVKLEEAKMILAAKIKDDHVVRS
jgi:anaerobic magnesium-protoporphyrin IX monomethyl ester cyclase